LDFENFWPLTDLKILNNFLTNDFRKVAMVSIDRKN